MIVQKFVVLLAETPTGCDGRSVTQIWLGYNAFGRIGNCLFSHAFRYESQKAAELALKAVRGVAGRRWPGAKVLGTTVDAENASQ